jgi:NhaA family Na+:H+ antiporter
VSAFLVVPLFALANAGVDLPGRTLHAAVSGRFALAIAVALVVGKALGIAGAALAAERLGAGVLPAGVGRRHLWGVAALGGIGFTVSLFIADLASALFWHQQSALHSPCVGRVSSAKDIANSVLPSASPISDIT